MNTRNISFSINVVFVLLAFVIVLDFALPGEIIIDKIMEVKSERQQYYNAARNFHYSYKVITEKNEFQVSEDFVQLNLDEKRIEYAVSRVFYEINWYKLMTSENKFYHSLRIISGAVLPLVAIISIFLVLLQRLKSGTFTFVIQTLLMADLIFLIV